MEALEGGVEPFVVAGQAAEARGPGKAALHNASGGAAARSRAWPGGA